MNVFYVICGRVYSYEQAKKKKRFDPDEGDKRIVRYLNEDGSMSDEEPTNEEVEAYLKNNRR